jgi:2-oxoisovalerate dehydrogenase E1 component beta subunit
MLADLTSVPVPLAYEKFYQPDVIRVFDKLVETLSY